MFVWSWYLTFRKAMEPESSQGISSQLHIQSGPSPGASAGIKGGDIPFEQLVHQSLITALFQFTLNGQEVTVILLMRFRNVQDQISPVI